MRTTIHLSLLIANLLSGASISSAASSPSLAAGSASGTPGTAVTMPISFVPGSTGVASLQCSIGLPSGWSIASSSAGPTAANAGKTVDVNNSNGMLIVFGVNQNTIGLGVVTNVKINIPSSAASGTYPVTISGTVFSALNGASVQGAASINGSVSVKSTISTAPTISSFGAAPASIAAGSSSTLSWNVTSATSLSISPSVGKVTGMSVSVSPTATTTYTLTATNSSGSVAATAKVTVTSAAVPTITNFGANPASIAAGTASTLSWNVTSATSLSISPSVGKVTGTSVSVSPTATTTYTLTATNSSGSARDTVTVRVTGSTTRPTITSFGSRPASIKSGGFSSLVWSVTGATSLSISPGVGTVTGTAAVVSPALTTSYELTATNSGGSVTATTTITVSGSAPPTINVFSASPASVASGASSMLSWNVSNATSLSISPDVGTITGTSVRVTPNATTTYTLTATNSAGSVIATTKVTITSAKAPTITSFGASPASIAAGGSSTLSWNVTGASGLSISPNVGTVRGTSTTVNPSATTTYTLVATNAAGSVSSKATIAVRPPQLPMIVSFTANPTTISSGASSKLSWNVTGPSSISISPGVGSVTGQSFISVNPTTTTSYTLTATNSAGSVTQKVLVTVTASTPGTPMIGLSVTSLVFTALESGPNAVNEPLVISNVGSGTLSWTASDTQDWLSLSPASGTNGPTDVVASVNSQGLGAGDYWDTITINAPGATEGAQSVSAELVVSATASGTPSLGVGSTTIPFTTTVGSNPASQGVWISNLGQGVLYWSATHSQSWLNLTPTSGVNGSKIGPTLMMWVNTQGLDSGSYSDVVTVTAPSAAGSPQSISVYLFVNAP